MILSCSIIELGYDWFLRARFTISFIKLGLWPFFRRARFVIELGLAIELGLQSSSRSSYFVPNSVCYRARFILFNSEERGLVSGLGRGHGPSESSQVTNKWRYITDEIWKIECKQRVDHQIIAHAAKLQGEHCVSWFFQCMIMVSFIKLLTSLEFQKALCQPLQTMYRWQDVTCTKLTFIFPLIPVHLFSLLFFTWRKNRNLIVLIIIQSVRATLLPIYDYGLKMISSPYCALMFSVLLHHKNVNSSQLLAWSKFKV